MPQSNNDTARRHDLDAVRSFAMLLGIALHAALAYIGGMWIVSDHPTSSLLAVSVTAIHGFRMPLFFLLSGFFTAMLWKKRGLTSLLKHRTQRIAIPLAIACVTIVPMMSWVSGWAITNQVPIASLPSTDAETREPAPANDIWTVAAFGDMDQLRQFSSETEQLNTPDPNYGVTPLGWATLKNYPDAVAYLLEIGAQPSAKYKDQNTPLHTACFFGRYEVAELLIDAGADLSIKNATNETPTDSLNHNEQTTTFIAQMIQVPIDFELVSEGREKIRLLTETKSAPSTSPSPSSSAFNKALHVNFFHHLWFLWYLCIFVIGFGALSAFAKLLPKFSISHRLVSLPLCLLWLIPLTMSAQWFMHAQGPGFGPDTSTGIIPAAHVLMYYSIFFGFGALVYLVRGADMRFGPPRSWTYLIPIASPFLFLGMTLEFSQGASDFINNPLLQSLLSDAFQVTYAWLMIFGFIALFESLFHRPKRWVRYMSDSSYWLYLAHLPLIIMGQTYLQRLDVNPVAKATFLTAFVTVILLGIYQLAIRYTPVGTLLNGKRVRP